MRLITINLLRALKKRLINYIALVLLIVISFATVNALYSNGNRVKVAFQEVINNSGRYNYAVKLDKITSFKDDQVANIQKIINKDIGNDLKKLSPSDKALVEQQIANITMAMLEHNLLPEDTHEILKEYWLTWVSPYAMLVKDAINKIDKKYQGITFSFNRNFTKKTKNNNITYNFEDAFTITSDELSQKNNASFWAASRKGINDIYIKYGTQPTKINEVVINPDFAKHNGFSLNKTFKPFDEAELKITGFGYSYFGLAGKRSNNNPNPTLQNTTPVFTTKAWFTKYIKENNQKLNQKNITFLLQLKNDDDYFASKFEKILRDFFNFDYGSLLVADRYDNESGAAQDNFEMLNFIFSAIALVTVIGLIFIILSYVRKEINVHQEQLIFLKALGFYNSQISISFTILIGLITFISFILGTIVSIPLQIIYNWLDYSVFFLPVKYIYFNTSLILFLIFIIPGFFAITSYLQAICKLKNNDLSTSNISIDIKLASSAKRFIFMKKWVQNLSFNAKMAITLSLQSFGKSMAIFVLFMIGCFLLLSQIIAISIFANKMDKSYTYFNPSVHTMAATISMDDHKNPRFDWVSIEKLDQSKEIIASDFQLKPNDGIAKFLRFQTALQNNFKNYYINSTEITKLYQVTHQANKFDYDKAVAYIGGADSKLKAKAEKLTKWLKNLFFNYFHDFDSKSENRKSLPGISFGQVVLNENSYPDLHFTATIINDQHVANKITNINIDGIYDANNLNWNSWFNLTSDNNTDLAPILINSPTLIAKKINYVDNFGNNFFNVTAYVVPTVIPKMLAVVNNYQINSEILILINDSKKFIPIILKVKAINPNEFADKTCFTNIDNLRKILNYGNENNEHFQNNFNNVYYKNNNIKNMIPLVYESNAAIFTPIFKSVSLLDIPKKVMIGMLKSTYSTLSMTNGLTLFAFIFILIIVINMIIDNNIKIISMMRVWGYRINEVNKLMVSSYLIMLIIAYFSAWLLSYLMWKAIINNLAATLQQFFSVKFALLTIFSVCTVIFLILMIGYLAGLYCIKNKLKTIGIT